MISEGLAIGKAPLRLSLAGGGTDLPAHSRRYGGDVLCAAIDLWVTAFVRIVPATQGVSVTYPGAIVSAPHVAELAHAHARGVIQKSGLGACGVEILSVSPVLPGTGLGSSGAFTVAALGAASMLAGRNLATAELAAQASRIEIEALNDRVGPQNPYASTYGAISRLRIETSGRIHVDRVNFPGSTLAELERRLILVRVGGQRNAGTVTPSTSADADYLKAVAEIGAQARAALFAGDLDEYARAIRAHWDVKKIQQPRAVSELVDRCLASGAEAAKLIGAGRCGYLLVYASPRGRSGLLCMLTSRNLSFMDVAFASCGAKFSVRMDGQTRE